MLATQSFHVDIALHVKYITSLSYSILQKDTFYMYITMIGTHITLM